MKVYKYIGADRTSIITNCCIRITQVADLNDPFEMKVVLKGLMTEEDLEKQFNDTLVDNVREIYNEDPMVSQMFTFPKFLQFVLSRKDVVSSMMKLAVDRATPGIAAQIERLEELVGILSLTEEPDNLLMWAHYAQNHCGLVIEFDGNSSFFNRKRSDGDACYHLRKVNYTNVRPSKYVIDMENDIIFLTKSLEWSYEREWRMLAPLQDADVPCDNRSVKLFSFDPKTITGVVFGARMPENKIKELSDNIKLDSRLTHIEMKRAELDPEKFALRIVPLGL